jgi:hypothetical protein
MTKICLSPLLSGGSENLWLIIPLILGLVIFLNQTREYSWVSRYPLQIALGIGIALGMRGTVDANIIQQIIVLIKTAKITVGNPWATFNDILGVLLSLAAIYYFFFHFAHKTPGHGTISKFARLGIMANFGVGLAGYMAFNATFILYQVANIIMLAPPPGEVYIAYASAIITVAVLGILYWAAPKYIFPRISEEARKTL